MGFHTLQQHIHVRDLVDKKVRDVRVDLDEDNKRVKIHYHGWNNKHDEFEDSNPLISQQTKEAIGQGWWFFCLFRKNEKKQVFS